MDRYRESRSRTQERLQCKCHVGAVPHFASGGSKKFRQALATLLMGSGNAHPTTGTQLPNRITIARGNRYDAIMATGWLRIADTP